MDNFQDRYIRTDPRRNAKMNPILWDDNSSRYFSHYGGEVECFENMSNSLEGYTKQYSNVNGVENELTTQVKCKNGKAEVMVNNNGNVSKKMYDIDLNSIADNKIRGTINEVDRIHNGNIVNSMSFDRMMLNYFSKSMDRLNTQVNNSVLSLHNRKLEHDPFFNPK